MKPRHYLFLWLAVLTALRLFYIGQLPLFPDEAYYKMWSERPDISYYSKGPGVAAAMWIGTHLFGESEFGVRVLSPLLGLGTCLLLFFLARRLFDEDTAVWTVLTASVIPIFNVGNLVMTIDPLSIFFWTATLATFWCALERSPGLNLFWPLTGLLIGLGFLAKYTNAIQLVSIIVIMAFTPKLRREFARPGFYSLLLVFVLCTLPPILWNARHEWITVAHLRARGGLDKVKSLNPLELLEFVGTHFGTYSPLIFLGIVIAMFWGWKRARAEFPVFYLLWFGLPLVLMYCLLSLREAGEANWTAPAFVSLIILSVALWLRVIRRSRPAGIFAVSALAVGLLMSAVVANTDLLRTAGIPLPYSLDPSTRMRGWRTTAEAVQEVRKTLEEQLGGRLLLIADSYQTAAALGYYLPEKPVEGPGHPPVYIPESQNIENQFSFWPRYDEFLKVDKSQMPQDAYYTEEAGINPFVGRNALYITDRPESKPASSVKNGFRGTEMIAVLEVRRRGLPLREIRIFACYNYQTLPL